MSAIAWVAVVVAVVVALGVVGYLVTIQSRRRHLQDRFGPEYDRTVQEKENRREAEQELLAREARFAELDIRPLDDEARETYAKKWMEVQERFVDAPGFAVTEADALVTSVMADRGYPTDGFEERVNVLSVGHGGTLDRYRQAHEISGRAARQEATTEELRQAMVHYRSLFEELLADTAHGTGRESASRTARDSVHEPVHEDVTRDDEPVVRKDVAHDDVPVVRKDVTPDDEPVVHDVTPDGAYDATRDSDFANDPDHVPDATRDPAHDSAHRDPRKEADR